MAHLKLPPIPIYINTSKQGNGAFDQELPKAQSSLQPPAGRCSAFGPPLNKVTHAKNTVQQT